MALAVTERKSVGTADLQSVLSSTARLTAGACLNPRCTDTVHSNPQPSGSAAQFNRSVSAMPSQASRNFPTLAPQGTADTLPLG
jgi:hypothetical protein